MSGRGGGRGRGAYYKEKYGRGGAGRGRSHNDTDTHTRPPSHQPRDTDGVTPSDRTPRTSISGSSQDLHTTLSRIHNRSYPAYHDIEGGWTFPAFTLFVDRVQGDPYAAPSRCRVVMPAAVAGYPAHVRSSAARRTLLCDFITRQFGKAVAASGGDVRQQSGGWQGEKGGEMGVDTPGQHVIERTSVLLHPDGAVEARFTVALPARGRSVLGDWADAILVQNLPSYCDAGLRYNRQDAGAVARHVESVEDQRALRGALSGLGLVAFVGDGAVLPRKTGNSDQPMPASEAVAFASPPSMAVQITLPNRGVVRGMGIPQGVTLICGGGFHGKSTLLEALEAGVYDKIPGDGRELVATDPGAVKIRAEDGRRVAGVDISPFINNLPYGRPTACFSTADASGSTSQATNIQEALECGASTLLIDEDTSATNFMVRDGRMRELVAPDKEPITPFVCRVLGLAAAGVSTVLVVGGTGEYFGAATAVVCMDSYVPEDATGRAHAIAARYDDANLVIRNAPGQVRPHSKVRERTVVGVHPGHDIKVKTRTLASIQFGEEELDLSGVEQLVEVSQTRAVAEALRNIGKKLQSGGMKRVPLRELLQRLEAEIDAGGLDVLGGTAGNLARPRLFEIGAAINRLRSAEVIQV